MVSEGDVYKLLSIHLLPDLLERLGTLKLGQATTLTHVGGEYVSFSTVNDFALEVRRQGTTTILVIL